MVGCEVFPKIEMKGRAAKCGWEAYRMSVCVCVCVHAVFKLVPVEMLEAVGNRKK